MQDNLFVVGFALIFLGMIIIIISSLKSSKVEYAFGGFIGPIPFGWASSKYGLILVILTLLAILLFFQSKI
ncbi:MAG: hypothetical protein QXM68_00995 [Candidatus Aenigmatarchaeota archaeon]|nr:hypothetical protein [Candidatus Aenigmarchaeota archaeon]